MDCKGTIFLVIRQLHFLLFIYFLDKSNNL